MWRPLVVCNNSNAEVTLGTGRKMCASFVETSPSCHIKEYLVVNGLMQGIHSQPFIYLFPGYYDNKKLRLYSHHGTTYCLLTLSRHEYS